MARSAAVRGASDYSAASLQSRRRSVITPEGVAINVILADLGSRVMAIIIDLVLLAVILVAIVAGIGLSRFDDAGYWALTAWFFASFVLRTFYFIYFELRWQGRTPGKRIVGLRVMDHRGGTLTSGAVFARNLTREVELFIPISLMIFNPFDAVDAWLRLALTVWLALFVLMPLFNRDRRRVGDLVGGTCVVEAPRAVLLEDVGTAANGRDQHGDAFRFTAEQLDEYGVFELQTLEQVLRMEGGRAEETRRAVAERVKQRIRWSEPPEAATADPRPFLEAYYAALRGHLETGMLFGRARPRKRQRQKGSVPPSPR